MAKLIYSAIASLDGYIEDRSGSFEWAMPDEEEHAFVNHLERPIGTYLYGRRMYDVMKVWETMGHEHAPAVEREFASIWKAADKIVYSQTLTEASTAKTRVERVFDPEAVRAMKESEAKDISVGGPTLAAAAFRAGLIDECGLLLHSISVGGGKPALPRDIVVKLELIEERRFASGVVYLNYRVT